MKTEAMKTQGAFSWNELMTTDVNGAKAFYGELLGWTIEEMNTPNVQYNIVKTGDVERAGIMAMPPGVNMPPAWGAYITVDDVDVMAHRVTQLGGKVVMPPQDIPNVGRFTVIADPQGAMVSLITYSDVE